MINSLQDKKIIISSHVYATGPAEDLRDYLNKYKVANVLFIGHPIFYDKNLKGSGYERFKKGKCINFFYNDLKQEFLPIKYIKELFLTLSWSIKFGKSDLFVGVDNLNAFFGILLQKIGLVKNSVYYVIDYDPHKYKNPFINWFYHKLDQFCVTYATQTWNLSDRMKEGRKKYFNYSGGNQKTVPIGIWFKRIKRKSFSQVKKHKLVFMGHIIETQGIQYVLRAIKEITKQIPDFSFLVIGGGEYLPNLKQLVKELNIKNVTFTGYVKKQEDIENMLCTCACAIAPYLMYEGNKLSRTYFADPGKVKSYLASGLPILITDVPHNAKDIERKKCGKIISFDSKSIAKAVVSLLKNEKILQKYRENAVEYARSYDWEIIFPNALMHL